ncbi:MAG: hypothetical protein IT380_01530 [Myxococcales bacterium]|nr:hypothetical protein [Myxococcales bacterium]
MPSRLPLLVTAVLTSLVVGALFGACGPTRSKCATVTCDGNRVCDEATGACVRGDGGVTDGGVDAGTDAGSTCVPDCVAPQVCDTATGRCVECFTDNDCACPATVCRASGACELPGPDAGLPAGGESCTTALAINSCGQNFSFTANLSAARDDVVGSCGQAAGGGKDLLWVLRLDATLDVTITARRSSGSLAEPVVSLRRDCDDERELACSDSLSGQASFRLRSLTPGLYTLVVDSFDASSAGRVDVTVQFSAPTTPANESCGTAELLPPDTDVTVNLSLADDDLQVSCNRLPSSAEAVYRLELTSPSDVFLTATGTTNVNPVLALRRSPCAAADQVRCVNAFTGTTESLIARDLPAGSYYVVLERGGPAVGSITLRASVTPPTPPPVNDTCSGARAITFPVGMNTVTFSVDTSLARDDEAGSCNAELDSPETVYALTLATRRSVTIVSRASAGATSDPVIYLRGGACDALAGQELGCSDAKLPNFDTLTSTLDPGTYFLFVEGFGPAGAGPTDVTVTLGP